MKTASAETRALVVKSYKSGVATRKQLAEIFGYHIQSIGNWIREFEREGRIAPLAKGHRKSVFTEEEKVAIAQLLYRDVDVTLKEIREMFGKSCSLVAIHKTISKLGFVFKKTLRASELEREDIVQSRNEWKKFQRSVDFSRLVFLDEAGLKTNMTRLYGRAFKGSRCHDTTPCGRWETTTILSSIRLDGTTESILFEGALDHKMFEGYIKEILAPQLRHGDILIMDNLSAHKSASVVEVVQSFHAEVKFLPAYSPDLNPIEKMWSKLKQIIRGLKPRSSQELFHDTGTALTMITSDDAQGWFESCGYI